MKSIKDFDQSFNRTRRAVNTGMIIALTLVVAFWIAVGYAIYSVASDPGQLGEAAGEVVKGYNETVK